MRNVPKTTHLDYETSLANQRRTPLWVAFTVVGCVSAGVFWWFGDWNIYLYDQAGEPSIPDSEMLLPVQVAISMLFGAVVGGAVVGVLWVRTRMRRPSGEAARRSSGSDRDERV